MRAWICWAILELAVTAPAAAGPEPSPEAGERVVYDVLLQQRATGKVEEFRRVGAVLFAPRSLLDQLGVPLPPAGEWVDLSQVAGLEVAVDESRQQISLRLAAALRPLTVLYFPEELDGAAQKLAPGLSLAYALTLQRDDSGDGAGAVRLTPRLFGPFGLFHHDAVYNSEERPRHRRIDSYWQYDFPSRAQVLRIGDAIAPGLAWSRAWRYGGVHFGSDFGLRPDLVTYPLPSFQGEAAVPSTLDIVVAGLRTQQGEVPDGPFAIPRVPVVSGGGEALVVMTDALGREQVMRLPFYVSTRLLRQGLNEFSFDAGKLRRGFGDRYAQEFAAFVGRRGLSDRFTGEVQVQAGAGLRSAGLGFGIAVGRSGALQLAATRSHGEACDGSQFYLASEWQRGRFSVNTSQQWTRRNFCDLASLAGSAPPRRQSQFGLGVETAIGHFNASHITRSAADGSRLQLDSLDWSRRLFARAWLSLGLQRLRDSEAGRDTALQFALLLPLWRDGTAVSVSGSGGARDRAVASLQRPAPAGLGWGYRVDSELQRHDLRAAIEWRTAPVDLRLEGVDSAAGTAWRAAAEGALVWLGGLHATRRLGEAFALVDTGGVGGLPILRENQVQGRSNSSGRFLVSELRPYEANRIAYEPRELPPEVEASGNAERVLYPYRGGGIRVTLGLQRSAAREWRLHLADGSPAPAGTHLFVDGVARQRVGHDGLVFLPPPSASEDWRLRGAFGECRLQPLDEGELRCGDVP